VPLTPICDYVHNISAIFAVIGLFCVILAVTLVLIYGGIQPNGKLK
jgi:hypothetical protein